MGVALATETKDDGKHKVSFLMGSGITTSYSDIRTSTVMGEEGTGNYTDNSISAEIGILYTIVDDTGPAIHTVTVGPTTGTAGTVFNITANVTDTNEISSVTAYIQKPDENNTAVITLSLTNNIYNGTWNSSGKADGTYVIDIIAIDVIRLEKEQENGAVIALSSSAVNVSVNSSVEMTANESVIINATKETDTWLNITTSANVTASIVTAKYSDNIKESTCPTRSTELGKYIDVIVDNNTNNNISSAEIRVYYTNAEVSAANLQESTLRLYRCNASSAAWNLISPGGVDTTLNYVWGNVTSFSSFGVFGTTIPAEAAPGAAAGAGAIGGGSISIEMLKEIRKELTLSQDSFGIDLVLEGSKREELRIANTGDVKLRLDISIAGISDYLFLSDASFELEAGESKTITLNFIGKELGIQIGKIVIYADGIKESIPVVINVESEEILFDVKMEIPAKYRGLRVGEELSTQVTLLSMGEPKKVDVFISYMIKDSENRIISKEYETVAVEKELSFVKSFPTKGLKPGEYVAAVEVDYAGSIAISGGLFTIEEYIEMPSPVKRYRSLLFAAAIIALVFAIVLVIRRKRLTED